MPSHIDLCLQECLEKTILVKLKDNRLIQGTLYSFDEQMNISLMDAKTLSGNTSVNLETIVLRGSMIVTVML